MKVMKFGGSSLGTPSSILSVIQIIQNEREKSHAQGLCVVVSAFQGVTDQLIEMGQQAAVGDSKYKEALDALEDRHLSSVKALVKEGELRNCIFNNVAETLEELSNIFHGVFLLKELSEKTQDLCVSYGELLSAYILSEALKSQGEDAEFLDTRDLIKTDESFGSARIYFERTYQNIGEFFEGRKDILVATGYIASTFNKETTTLGRGGSDYTASIIGRALKVSSIEIWTDVDGVMTADPKKVGRAFPIRTMTYEEAMEMSHFGAKVLHPPTMQPAVEEKIPLVIKNTFNPGALGTVISGDVLPNGHAIKGISSIDEVTLLRIQGPGMVGISGISMRLFSALAKRSINIILITQGSSEHSICLAVAPNMAQAAKREIEEEFSLEIFAKHIEEVILEGETSVVAVVGEKMCDSPGIAGRVFSSLGKHAINVMAIAQGSSEFNISFVVKKSQVEKALNVIHDAFFYPARKLLHIFLVGLGRVGQTLLEQLSLQQGFLSEVHQVEIRVVGAANSKRMVFDEKGLDALAWKERVQYSHTPMSGDPFLKKMKEMNLRNSVFVDCTDSQEVADLYEKVLKAGFSIVTSSKVANTQPHEKWRALRSASNICGSRFLYETNVGAALPVINTLHGLLYSGDRIEKVEAVLSGSLSFIFNSVSKEKSFSSLLEEAMEQGYTESDPRKDLNGLDVARKILILARECGSKLEIPDVTVENIMGQEFFQEGEDLEKFLRKVKAFDETFEKRRLDAEKKACVLRYVACFEKDKASVKVVEVDSRHPFYNLSGTDNMICFTTKRYKDRPLVIRGPGAGSDVTAGGVFADIMHLSHGEEETRPCP